jgi:hypothetical protein
MSTVLLPLFAAEARVLTDALRTSERAEMATLLKVVVPDVYETPARMKRLNNALGEWLMAAPRSWRDMEEARQGFAEVFDAHAANVARVHDEAHDGKVSAEELARLERTRQEMERLRSLIFDRWQPFTREKLEQALSEIREGKFTDIDEVIRELQARGD